MLFKFLVGTFTYFKVVVVDKEMQKCFAWLWIHNGYICCCYSQERHELKIHHNGIWFDLWTKIRSDKEPGQRTNSFAIGKQNEVSANVKGVNPRVETIFGSAPFCNNNFTQRSGINLQHWILYTQHHTVQTQRKVIQVILSGLDLTEISLDRIHLNIGCSS